MRRFIDLVLLDRLDRLIRRKATGVPEYLAERLGISRSSLFEVIKYLKDEMDAPIIYDRGRLSYTYEYTPKFFLGFERERLNTQEMDYSFGAEEDKKIKSKKKKIKTYSDGDSDDYILDEDINFNDLYID